MSERFDVLVTGEDGGHQLPKEGLRAVLRWLAATGVANPNAESVAQGWVAVYAAPGSSAHAVFIDGQAPAEPVFHEICVWTGRAEPLPYGEGKSCFYVEFRGCLYDQLLGSFRKHLAELVHIRPRVVSRPHTALAGHREVPEDERPLKPEPSQSKAGAVGVRVEEF